MTQYEFVNCWPTNLTSMRVAYGDSNVLRCNVQFAYDRFFTEFTRQGDHRQFAVESPLGITESKEIASTTTITGVNNQNFLSNQQKKNEELMKNIYKGDGSKVKVPNLPNLK